MIDPQAERALSRHLRPSEQLLWATSPDIRRMAPASIWNFVRSPYHLVGVATIGGVLIAAQLVDTSSLPGDWAFLAMLIVAALASPLLIDVGDAMIRLVPFYTPTAYGSTKNYLLLRRGLFFSRLERFPLSEVSGFEITNWRGNQAIVFHVASGPSADFSFLHCAEPDNALAALTAIWRDHHSNAPSEAVA